MNSRYMKHMKVSMAFFLLMAPLSLLAQTDAEFSFVSGGDEVVDVVSTTTATTTASEDASSTAAQLIDQQRTAEAAGNDVTMPEEQSEKAAILELFDARPVETPLSLSFTAYWVQWLVQAGLPANTVYLILLTPILALMVSFVRVVIGLPTLDMLVPIALSFALVAVGINIGLLVLGVILLASYISKRSLTKIRIMFYPKRSLAMFFLAIGVFIALTAGLALEFERILTVSIFPILILILLGDQIVSVLLHKSVYQTILITGTTIALGVLGYILAVSSSMQNLLILYPELVYLVLPLNILIGRYFGLRVLELFRFRGVPTE